MSTDPTRKEDARRECLRFLAERHLLAHSADNIRRRINRDGFDFTPPEILSAIEVLHGLGLITARTSPLSASLFYQATAAGVLHHERHP